MKKGQVFVSALILLSSIVGCGDDSSSKSAVTQGVTFIDKGAVVPKPISTTTSIDSNSIKYSQSQSGQIIGGWSKPIQFADYTSVRKIISDNQLYASGNILPTGAPSCTGSAGMTINIQMENGVHSFDIDGGIYCNRNKWPAGVRDLVNLEEALVLKYK
jgi:hypothetical protein